MANEKRLIWDEDAKRHLIALAVGHHSEMLHIDVILNAILHHTTTVDAVEVVHSSWGEGRFNTNGEYEEQCLNCKMFSIAYGSDYCPNCGAIMDGDGNA